MVDTWHDASNPQPGCVHCDDSSAGPFFGAGGGHYLCTASVPCQDCADDAQTARENVAAGYGPNGEDTGYEY